jgi:adenine-specific DNA-methyltransferase
MNNKKQKLELTWIGKDKQPILEPRILIENPEFSYPKAKSSSSPLSGDLGVSNLLIKGDNLLALKALEQDFAGKIKCIYIDPPYNTGNAFEHYDDGLEHSLWLSLMRDRLVLLRTLLSEDGSIWISIDDDESHYLKILCDELFGRVNFVNNVIWEKKYSPQNDARWLSDSHDHILVFAKNKEIWRPNLLPRGEKQNVYYKYDDNDGRGLWRSDNILVKSFTANRIFPIKNPNTGQEYFPPEGRCWRFSEETAMKMLIENRFYFGKDGKGAPQVKRYLSEVKDGITSLTIFKREEVGDNQEAKNEVKEFNPEDVFATPKPERLIERILTLATKEGDLVLDSFLGSGTTAAVAHKMNRRWIGIELGEHAKTHCVPRLKKVIDGTDQGGISQAMNWKGGGSFKFYELAPSLLKKDARDNCIIEPKYNADMLAAALAKQEGYTYKPDEEKYWKQGYSTERDYIFTTTQFLTVELLDRIHEEMGQEESLLICATSFSSACQDKYLNITVKKIPQMLLGRCEFGKEDYSLNVVNLPCMEEYPPAPLTGGEEDNVGEEAEEENQQLSFQGVEK